MAATSGIFSDVTGKLDMLVIIEIDHEILVFIATLEEAATFPLTHSIALTSSSLSSALSLQSDEIKRNKLILHKLFNKINK